MPSVGACPVASLAEAKARRERESDGQVFRALRVELRLSLREIAAGWGVSPAMLGELERGRRRFASPADLFAALQQLWQWACERHTYATLGSPRWRARR
nr:helix-turn-helix transcriptional regulator [Myxococcus sp. AS-1-15]